MAGNGSCQRPSRSRSACTTTPTNSTRSATIGREKSDENRGTIRIEPRATDGGACPSVAASVISRASTDGVGSQSMPMVPMVTFWPSAALSLASASDRREAGSRVLYTANARPASKKSTTRRPSRQPRR